MPGETRNLYGRILKIWIGDLVGIIIDQAIIVRLDGDFPGYQCHVPKNPWLRLVHRNVGSGETNRLMVLGVPLKVGLQGRVRFVAKRKAGDAVTGLQ